MQKYKPGLTGLSDVVLSDEKFSDRAVRCEHPIIKQRIKKLKQIDYELFSHDSNYLDKTIPIFTLILTMHGENIGYVEKSLQSVFAQTYRNTEVILINNGAEGAVAQLIWETFLSQKNAKLIRVSRNLFNPLANNIDDPIVNLWNAGLFCSDGDFVFFLAYDDLLSIDYVERMVALFVSNAKCNTAAPMVVSIDDSGAVNIPISEALKAGNVREKYTDGIWLVKNFLRDGGMITFPGGLLAARSDLVLKLGGFDKMSDLSQLFKIGIHGESGFDPEAKLFWRHHSHQTNKVQAQMGMIYFTNYQDFMEDYGIKSLHQSIAGNDFADEFEWYMAKRSEREAIQAFCYSYRFGLRPGLMALRRIFRECPARVRIMAIVYCFIGFPAFLYSNWAPESLKLTYRRLRKI